MTGEARRRKQHLVSNGYQKNFSDGGRVAIIQVSSASVVDDRRRTKDNWWVEDFLSVPDQEVLNDTLEHEISATEKVALNQLREIVAFEPLTASQRRSLDDVAIIHLMRSRTFEEVQRKVATDWLPKGVKEKLNDPQLQALFRLDRGRPPANGELEKLVNDAAHAAALGADSFARSVRQGIRVLRETFDRSTVQLIRIGDSLPGLVLADNPVVHGLRREGRFGFADGVAVGDADTIILPIHRRLAACYSGRRLGDVELRTRNDLDRVNALLSRVAREEVLCHPDDALPTSRLMRNLHQFRPPQFDGNPAS